MRLCTVQFKVSKLCDFQIGIRYYQLAILRRQQFSLVLLKDRSLVLNHLRFSGLDFNINGSRANILRDLIASL